MSMVALRHQTKYLVKCDQCGRTAFHTYHVPFGDFVYKLCSGECVEKSRATYEEKKMIKFDNELERSPDFIEADYE